MVLKKKKASGKSKWKALQFNESLLASGIEGLIGIEELTNYTLVQNKKNNRSYDEISDPKYKIIRIKATGHSQIDPTPDEEMETLATEIVTKKTKKKKQNPSVLESVSLDTAHGSEKNNSSKIKKKATLLRKISPQSNITEILHSTDKEKEDSQLSKTSLKPVQLKRKHSAIVSTEQEGRNRHRLVNKKQKAVKSSVSSNEYANVIEGNTSKTSNEDRCKTKMASKTKIKSSKIPKKKKINSKKLKRATMLNAEDFNEDDISCESPTLPPVQGMEGWGGLNLPDSILRALAEKGFTEPTEIQARSLPAAVLGRRDIMGAAETGSGKTLAFGIPIIYGILQQKLRDTQAGLKEQVRVDTEKDEEDLLSTDELKDSESSDETEDIGVDAKGFGCVRVIDNIDFESMGESIVDSPKPINPGHNHKLYALVLTPTRELAVQVRDHLVAAAKYTGIRVAVVIGGLAAQKQERLLRTKPEIVVATPGRLWELIQEGNAHLQQVDSISYLAIDETDRMTEKGHFLELRSLLERINTDEAQVKRRQNFVFSATLTMVHEPPQRKKKGQKKMRVTPGQKLQEVMEMVGITQPKIVDVTQKSGMSGTLEEAQIRCSFSEKDIYLYYFLLRHPGRTLVFCNSISCVRRLAQLMSLLQCRPLPIHANMMQKQRLRNLDKFRDSPTGLLLATDVAARGLDIPDVQHVIHYQVPRTSEGYVHRSGRTARASKEGLTLLLVEPDENQAYTRLCRTLGRAKELPDFEVAPDLLTAAKQRVNLARDIDQLELTSRRSDAELGWFQKAMTDMDMVLDKDDLPMRISKKETASNRKVSAIKRKELASLLSRPLFATRK